MIRTALSILLLAGAAASAWPALAQVEDGRYYGPHMWDAGWWMFLGPLWMIVVIAAIVAGVVLLVRWLGGAGPAAGHGHPPARTPLDILKERFARGEIDKDEFEERKRLLG